METTDTKLKLHIEAIETLEAEKKAIADDVSDRYKLAKVEGYDTKAMRQIVRLRKLKPDDRRYMDEMLEVYRAAMGID